MSLTFWMPGILRPAQGAFFGGRPSEVAGILTQPERASQALAVPWELPTCLEFETHGGRKRLDSEMGQRSECWKTGCRASVPTGFWRLQGHA